jgi:hypothetical protein
LYIVNHRLLHPIDEGMQCAIEVAAGELIIAGPL